MTDQQLPNPVPGSARDLLRTEDVQARFREVLKDKAPQFIASLANLVYQDKGLRECEPWSVIAASLVAASLDLPIDRNLGFAYIIPYNDAKKRQKVAQFQMGYKGYVQLALRTAQYRTIHVAEVYAGEIRSVNRFTGAITFGDRTSADIVGYVAYLQLLNGFEKYVYMTVDELRAHGEKYSKTFSRDDSKWKTDFDGMCRKTVVRRLLTKWGMLSVEMRQAIQAEIPPDDPAAPPPQLATGNGNGQGTESPAETDYTDPAAVAAEIERTEKDNAALFGK